MCSGVVYVPGASSGRFRRVRVCAIVGSGGRFRNVPESYGVVCCCLVRGSHLVVLNTFW